MSWGVLTHAQRSANAKKAALTRKREGKKAFGGKGWGVMSPAKRHEAALKAAATRKREGIKPFGHETAAKRHEAALKAAATRRAEGIKPFSHETAAQRSLAAKKAAITRAANKGTSVKTVSTSTTSTTHSSHGHTINPHRHRAGRLTPATRKHLGHIRRHHKVSYHQHLVRHHVTSHHTVSLGGHTGRLGKALNNYELSRKKPVQLRVGSKAHAPKKPVTHSVVSRNPRRLHLHK